MKILHFRYEMELGFSQEVSGHYFLVRVRPMETERQHSVDFSCRIHPEASLSEIGDGFGNRGFSGSIMAPHKKFAVEAEGTVEVREAPVRDFHPMYRYPSWYTGTDTGLRAFLKEAEEELGGPAAGVEGALFLMDRLYGRFIYMPGVTTVKTTAAEALRGGRGVCQDYAHIFISLCRLAGIPARYVAGMMVGEGATHAWAEAWDGEEWVGFDPTHNCLVDGNYIKLSHGRDFADGAVDKGCFLGSASQAQQIYVKVEELV